MIPPWKILVFAAVVTVGVTVALLLRPASETADRNAASQPPRAETQRAALEPDSGDVVNGDSDQKRRKVGRCNLRGSDEVERSLRNAVLIYRNYNGPEADPGYDSNRAAGCFLKTGRITEFGFADVIEGETFGEAKAAGDFVAFSTDLWAGADQSESGFLVWNLRSGKKVPTGYAFPITSDECSIHDFKLTSQGSLAFIACDSETCRLYVKLGGAAKRTLEDRFSFREDLQLSVNNGQLEWVGDEDQRRSIPFS